MKYYCYDYLYLWKQDSLFYAYTNMYYLIIYNVSRREAENNAFICDVIWMLLRDQTLKVTENNEPF